MPHATLWAAPQHLCLRVAATLLYATTKFATVCERFFLLSATHLPWQQNLIVFFSFAAGFVAIKLWNAAHKALTKLISQMKRLAQWPSDRHHSDQVRVKVSLNFLTDNRKNSEKCVRMQEFSSWLQLKRCSEACLASSHNSLQLWHLSGATTQPTNHTQMLLLLLQPQFCNVYCEESSPNSPFIFAVSSASCLLICGTSTHTQTHTCRQLECHCQPGKRSKTRPHLCCNWGIWFICNAARLCRVYRVYRVYSHAICWHRKHKCLFLNTPLVTFHGVFVYGAGHKTISVAAGRSCFSLRCLQMPEGKCHVALATHIYTCAQREVAVCRGPCHCSLVSQPWQVITLAKQ